MEVGFCFFVKWVLHLLRGIVVQGKKKKKSIWLQEEAGEFHGRENHWGSLTPQKSHLAEFHHLKIAGGWNSVQEDLYLLTLLLLSPDTVLMDPKTDLCIKPPWAWWPTGLTPVMALCSYSQFCLDGLFLLTIFYQSFPVHSPSSFSDIIHINVYYMCRKQNLPGAEAQVMLLMLLQTLSVLPLKSVGPEANPSLGSSHLL